MVPGGSEIGGKVPIMPSPMHLASGVVHGLFQSSGTLLGCGLQASLIAQFFCPLVHGLAKSRTADSQEF